MTAALAAAAALVTAIAVWWIANITIPTVRYWRKKSTLVEAPVIGVMTTGLIRECAHCGYWQGAAWGSPFERTEHDCAREGVTYSIIWKRAS